MMTRLYPGHEMPQFWELARKKWEQANPWRLTVAKEPRWCWSDHWWPSWWWLLDVPVLFLHVTPLPSSVYKSSYPTGCCGVGCGESASVASIWNKANFPFHQPGLFFGFWVASSWTTRTLSVTWLVLQGAAPYAKCGGRRFGLSSLGSDYSLLIITSQASSNSWNSEGTLLQPFTDLRPQSGGNWYLCPVSHLIRQPPPVINKHW